MWELQCGGSAEMEVNHGMKISNKPSGLSANVYNVYNVQFKKKIFISTVSNVSQENVIRFIPDFDVIMTL